jgi:polar amino acid transport system ATP-binding protein
MVSEVLAVIRRLAREGMTMAIVTHEMEFARDVSTRVFFMDQGLIYEEGPPARIFEAPQRELTREFINKVRSLDCTITSRDYDLYALFGQIERFCEKHALSIETAQTIELLAEELLALLVAGPDNPDIHLVVAYSEKSKTLEVKTDSAGPPANPLENPDAPDNLGRILIETYARDIGYSRYHNRNQ